MVRCCRTYEEVCEGDVGKVIKLDRDGLHDLNVQCDWQQKGGTYWVRYIHVELLGKFTVSFFLSKNCHGIQREISFGGWKGTYLVFILATARFPTTEFCFSYQDR